MNLFLTTRRLSIGHYEDHLTEFFAAALQLSERARHAYFDIAIRPFAEKSGWGACHITNIDTQFCFDEAKCRPDMVLTLSNGKTIGCEHKLDACETLGPEVDERLQLERYLDLEIDALIYVRASWKPPSPNVLRNPKYIVRPGSEHWLWTDFYKIFEKADEPFCVWMREAFEQLGFTPPHPWIGELETENDRRNFAKLWSKTRSFAHELGWSVSAGSITQLYLHENRNSLASWIYIQPSPSRFLFRVTPRKTKKIACLNALIEACARCSHPVEHGPKTVPRAGGSEKVYEIGATAAHVLGTGPHTAQFVEERLYLFISHFLSSVQIERRSSR
jgi:hypothetical protein